MIQKCLSRAGRPPHQRVPLAQPKVPLAPSKKHPSRWSLAALGLALLLLPAHHLTAQVSLGNGATMEVLGTDTAALLGGDLTDPENDGDKAAGPEDLTWNWKSIDSNNEPGFGGGEFSFNVFDNTLAGGNGKWCCDDATEDQPKNITVEFFEPVRLTHFTISSANDTPGRDPLAWQIQGSNDGVTFEPIFIQDSDESQWGGVRHQVNRYNLDVPAKPYTFIRFESTRTADPLHQLGEIEYFGEFGLGAPKIELIGTGTAALVGGDLTDPDNNGDEMAGPGDPSWNWESITSNNKPGFGGGEFAFNIFDNKVGGGSDKWCCDDATAASPLLVDVKFRAPVVLRYFTITSGNDARDREPLRWQIAGSNDGLTYTPIFTQDSATSIWTNINQVAKITLPAPAPPYQYLRYIVTDTAGPLHQLNEIEYFGDVGGVSKPTLSGRKIGPTSVRFDITDGGDSTLNAATVVLKIDGATAATTQVKTGAVTSFTHVPSPRFEEGSTHAYEITGQDSFGNPLKFNGEFKQPIPWLPAANLPGPEPVEGQWATRYIFNVGTIDSIPSALAAIQAAAAPDFTGSLADATSEVLNHGNGGIFGNPLAYADEATALGCCTDDFIMLSIGHIKILEEDDYTFGVHSDDGFAMRIRGATAVSKNGAGELDPGDPEAVVHPANTGDSNTRAVYHLKPGIYRIEFFWWERGGGDHGELYVARGAFANDGDTLWNLVGELTSAQSFAKLGVDAAGWSVVSSDPGGEQLTTWELARADLEASAGPPENYDLMNIGDPTTNGGVLPFPKNTALDDDDFALRGTAKLVVPANGTYVIGFNSDDGAYVKINGQSFTELLVNGTGLSTIDETGAVVTCDCLTGDSNTQAVITLTQGTYDIEVGMFDRGGGGFLAVKGVELGSPVLPILAKNGAGTLNVPAGGVALTSAPVTTGGTSAGVISSVEINGNNLVITYKASSAAATTAKIATSSDLKTWSPSTAVPAVVGGNLVFTLPKGAAPVVFYRVAE